ncbi:MAG TPA: CdaR family protein [Pyrinomonadaceae bacterium]
MDIQPAILFIKHILRKVFLEDWVMKLVALAITLALWLGVTGLSTPTTQRLTGIPLSLRFSNNIEVTNSPIQEVTLVVSGDSRRLAQINKNDLVVSMDISDVMPGDRVISLAPETVSVSLPTGVKLDEIQPRNMAVRIETVEERDVPVKAEIYGDLPYGHEIYEEIVNPAKVRVRGPAGFVRTLESVTTERIDVSNRTTDFTARQVPVSVSNPKASVLSETVVDVTFRIGEERIERVYSVPIDDGSGRRAQVVLFGGRSLVENVSVSNLEIEITRNDSGQEVPRAILPPELNGRLEIRSVKLRG